MNAKIVAGFFAGAALASVGTYWITHHAPSAPIAVEAPAPAPPPAVSSPATAQPEPPPPPEPAPAPPKVTAKKHEKKPAPKPPVIAHRLPPFHDHPAPLPRPEPAPAPGPAPSAPVEIAAAQPPVVEPPATNPAPLPVVSNPVEEAKVPEPPQPNTVTMAAGAVLVVRIGETLSTKKNRPGDSFTGTLDHELDVEGFVIAEKGARVEGRVSMVEEAGRMRGLSHLGIELTNIHTSDGQAVTIRTAQFEKLGPQSRREDAEKVGAGTVLGAVIGAAAGGGKGAAIGAGAGAAAGAGTVAATRGRPAEIPAETVVSFKLDQPVALTEKLQQ